jgi:hypothetical protein
MTSHRYYSVTQKAAKEKNNSFLYHLSSLAAKIKNEGWKDRR